jgi:hypothetical protein
VGDLVYHFDGMDYVIELKWIDYEGESCDYRDSRTVKTRNRQKLKDAVAQAEKYGMEWLSIGRPYYVNPMAIINNKHGWIENIHPEEYYKNFGNNI